MTAMLRVAVGVVVGLLALAILGPFALVLLLLSLVGVGTAAKLLAAMIRLTGALIISISTLLVAFFVALGVWTVRGFRAVVRLVRREGAAHG